MNIGPKVGCGTERRELWGIVPCLHCDECALDDGDCPEGLEENDVDENDGL